MNTSKRKTSVSTESPSSSPPANKKTCHKIVNHGCDVVVNSLRKIAIKYEDTCKSVIKVLKVDPRTKFKTHFSVAAMPEFMKRIHSFDFSNRIVFLNSSGNSNRFNCNVFVLMIDSHVGALPLGFFITSNKSTSLLQPTFRALNEIFPKNAMNTYPFVKVVITGIDNGEHTAMDKCFPPVKTFIGTFHLLRDIWRFLNESENKIDLNDRSYLFKLFENIVRSQSEDEFDRNIHTCKEDETYKKYLIFQKYLLNLLRKKELWGLDFRVRKYLPYDKDVVISEKHVLKEDILHRCRACSVTELFEFLCTTYCDYYKQKIIDSMNGIIECLNELRYMPVDTDEVCNLKVAAVFLNEVMVVNTERKSEFCVNRELGSCSCILGKFGSPCIHQTVVAAKFNSYLFRIAAMSEDQKVEYKYLAEGGENRRKKIHVNSTEHVNGFKAELLADSDDLTEYVIVSSIDDEENILEVQTQSSSVQCSPAIENIYKPIVEEMPATENCIATIKQQRSSEDCIRAIETFWSKLADYVEDHADQVYDWISFMNDKLDGAKSFDDVLSILQASSKREVFRLTGEKIQDRQILVERLLKKSMDHWEWV